jgi:predicted DNA-binding protein
MVNDNEEHLTVRLSSELRAACQSRADEVGQTLAEWIRRALREKLERDIASSDDYIKRIKDLEADVACLKSIIKATEE